MIELAGNQYRRGTDGVWGIAVDDDLDNDYSVSPTLCAALDEIEDTLFTLRVQLGFVTPQADDEKKTVTRIIKKARP